MVNDVVGWVTDITSEMSTTEWAIAGVLALLLVVAIVQQLVKMTALVVVLIAVGLFLMNGRVENWSF